MEQSKQMTRAILTAESVLLAGFGQANQAVARALRRAAAPISRIQILAFDDNPTATSTAEELDVELVKSPDVVQLRRLLAASDVVLPTPGMSDFHQLFELLDPEKVLSEYDIFAALDNRPFVAVTGTNGKTTVTELTAEMLCRSGIKAVAAGNTYRALTDAAADLEVEIFVVEASSFQLRHTKQFQPLAAAWLNFAPDHLDVHRSLRSYEDAKSLVWGCSQHSTERRATLPIANADDQVVSKRAPDRAKYFSCAKEADFCVSDRWLIAEGEKFAEVAELPRNRPHDLANALAATALTLATKGNLSAVAEVLNNFSGLAHRLQLVAEGGGVKWYNDSKATTPHATAAAVSGFKSVVLIAGGRNKGLDLTPIAAATPTSSETRSSADSIEAVVAIGETASEIGLLFAGRCPVTVAESMAEAVRAAAELAKPGDAVLLSPGCSSHDWYLDYQERGNDFTQKAQVAAKRVAQ